MKIKQTLVNGWLYPELYAKMRAWVLENGRAWIDVGGGKSWIDGTEYISTVWLYSNEDLLVFNLTFGDICAYHQIIEYDYPG